MPPIEKPTTWADDQPTASSAAAASAARASTLTGPAPLGYSPLYGRINVEQGLRTRIGFRQVEDVLARRSKLSLGDMQRMRPWWIRAHRCVAIPFRTVRRRLLTALGIRSKSGHAFSEAFPEIAHRRAA